MASLTSAEQARESSMLTGILADCAMVGSFTAVAFWSGSLTIWSEVIRGGLLILLEIVVLVLLRRIHRRRMADYEFGTGKLEQAANLAVAVALAVGALWLSAKALGRLEAPPPPGSAGSMIIGTLLTVVNLALNSLVAVSLWRAGRDGTSVIMTGQIRNRLSKVFASVMVVLAMLVAAWAPGSHVSLLADICGTLFVAAVMLGFAWKLAREALPDLLDRSLDERRQTLLNRALSARFEDYSALLAVRSRQSGRDVQIEVELGLPPRLSMAEADRVIRGLEQEVEALLPGARIAVLVRAWPG